jgi:DNA-binding HxlR family transcriptional regulator
VVQDNPTREHVINMVEKTVAIIGDKWSLLMIGQLAFGKSPSRFNELMNELKPISSRTLSIKLAKLTENGILEKTVKHASPPYTQYTLTEKGEDLLNALKAMGEWSFKWLNSTPSKTIAKSQPSEDKGQKVEPK